MGAGAGTVSAAATGGGSGTRAREAGRGSGSSRSAWGERSARGAATARPSDSELASTGRAGAPLTICTAGCGLLECGGGLVRALLCAAVECVQFSAESICGACQLLAGCGFGGAERIGANRAAAGCLLCIQSLTLLNCGGEVATGNKVCNVA